MSFQIEQKVFAKVRGYPPWPARILDIKGPNNPKSIRFVVYFYKTKESATLKFHEVFPFIEMKSKMGKPKKIKNFKEAMEEIMADLTPEEKMKLEQFESGNLESTPRAVSSKLDSTPKKREFEANSENDVPMSKSGRILKPKLHPEYDTNQDTSNNKVLEVMIGKDTIKIPNDKERLDFMNIEGDLLEIDFSIRKSLSCNNPNLPECIKLLDALLDLKITQIMLKKHPDIVYTLKKSRRYHEPEKTKLLTKTTDTDLAAIVRSKSEDVIAKFAKLFVIPESSSFYEYFDRVSDEFKLQTGNLSLQEYVDLM